MSNVNKVILQELSLDDIKAHFNEHHKKYAAALAAAFAGYAGRQGYKAYKARKQKENTINHFKNNREIYAGAATGALASLASSGHHSIGNKLKLAGISGMGGALAGSLLKNMRSDREHELKSKK